MAAPSATTTQPSAPRPLFGGYALVAVVVAWLAGIALRALGPLAALNATAWLIPAGGAALLGLAAALLGRRNQAAALSPWPRALLAVGMLGCFVALGAARAAAADPTNDPHSVARLVAGPAGGPANGPANGGDARLRGEVAAEPDLRAGDRLLTVDVSQASIDGGRTWQPATGRVEATVPGPDDWFSPAYGDTLSLTGTLRPLAGGFASPGVVARMTGARATVDARGGGNPLLARLFALRVALAQVIQRTLPEPEAALLIGVLLGLKTPVLRARLALFTATGTIHLVVPAGLKVAVLAELASAAARPLGRWLRSLAALLAVALYAALGGGGPAALRAAIMGALLVLAPVFGRAYNVLCVS